MQDQNAVKMTFFARAEEDLKAYDARVWFSYGLAKPVYEQIKTAIANAKANGKNDVLGSTYINAIFLLNNTNSGPELKELLLRTLEDVYSKRIDAGDFYFSPDYIFKASQINETIKEILNQSINRDMTIKVQIEKVLKSIQELNKVTGSLDEALKNTSGGFKEAVEVHKGYVQELQKNIDNLRELSSNKLQDMNSSVTTVSNSVNEAKKSIDELVGKLYKLNKAVEKSTSLTENSLVETKTLSDKFSKLWERHNRIVIAGGIMLSLMVIFSVAYIAYNYGRKHEKELQIKKKAIEDPENPTDNRDKKIENKSRCNVL